MPVTIGNVSPAAEERKRKARVSFQIRTCCAIQAAEGRLVWEWGGEGWSQPLFTELLPRAVCTYCLLSSAQRLSNDKMGQPCLLYRWRDQSTESFAQGQHGRAGIPSRSQDSFTQQNAADLSRSWNRQEKHLKGVEHGAKVCYSWVIKPKHTFFPFWLLTISVTFLQAFHYNLSLAHQPSPPCLQRVSPQAIWSSAGTWGFFSSFVVSTGSSHMSPKIGWPKRVKGSSLPADFFRWNPTISKLRATWNYFSFF